MQADDQLAEWLVRWESGPPPAAAGPDQLPAERPAPARACRLRGFAG
jgi:hypothetical protein